MTPQQVEDFDERVAICRESGVNLERAIAIASAQLKRPVPARGGAKEGAAATGRGVDGLDDMRASTGLEGAR